MGPGTYYESEIGLNSQLKVQSLRTVFCFSEMVTAGQSSVNEIDYLMQMPLLLVINAFGGQISRKA